MTGRGLMSVACILTAEMAREVTQLCAAVVLVDQWRSNFVGLRGICDRSVLPA